MDGSERHAQETAPGEPAAEAEGGSAIRRTRLAVERTQLAWWRTGIAALALALGVGQVLPEVDDSSVRWPYVLLGVAFAVYAIALIWFGSWRVRTVEREITDGMPASQPLAPSLAFGIAGAALGVAIAAVIVLS